LLALASLRSGLSRSGLASQGLLLTLPFVGQQVVRLVSNIILARLLAPEMFGVMVLINTLRTGLELLSDIGIGQSVVRSPHAEDQRFLDTAWTLQLVRGLALTVVALVAAEPLAAAFGNPEFARVAQVFCVVFLLTGAQSPTIFVMQRDLRVGQRGIYDMAVAVGQSAIIIALALWLGNLWALVWGVVLGTVLSTALTFAFPPYRLPRLALHREHMWEILHFGKWVFLSTAIYFAAMSTDRLYFSAVLPLAVVGVYGVARTFADLLITFAQRLGSFLVFPKVVELRQRGDHVAGRYNHYRRIALAAIAVAMAGSLAVSDALVMLLYDSRYHAAAFMLPVLLAGAWFAVLAAFAEATLFGLDRPQTSAVGNLVKFAIMIVGLPITVPAYGVFAGLLVLLAAEVGRWLALSVAMQRVGFASVLDDLGFTVAAGAGALAGKAVLGAVGLVPTLAAWWAMGAGLRG
jgi:O-antigen/teichoic acid export membrane protein